MAATTKVTWGAAWFDTKYLVIGRILPPVISTLVKTMLNPTWPFKVSALKVLNQTTLFGINYHEHFLLELEGM